MNPVSRGDGPAEYTLRFACELGFQFQFEAHSAGLSFVLDDVTCLAQTVDDRLVISAAGFANAPEAARFFYRLQHRVADAAVRDRIAISIPSDVEEASPAPFQLPEGESSAKKPHWPKTSIQPMLIYSTGAWIYPEHEFVLLSPIYSVKPTFQGSLRGFVSSLQGVATPAAAKADPLLLLAAASYTQAIRSTQWVWSFLLTVMTLEMLCAKGPRKKAVVSLVQKYCAPTVAANPRPDLFTDPADCAAKVAAVYDLRSQYTHEGHVPSGKQGMPSFQHARDTALQSLAHIIHERLAGR